MPLIGRAHRRTGSSPSESSTQYHSPSGPLTTRLVSTSEATEKVTTSWDTIVIDKWADLVESAVVVRDMARRVPVVVFVANHYAGHAPATARELRRLLGMPEPVPPERPRTTLFD